MMFAATGLSVITFYHHARVCQPAGDHAAHRRDDLGVSGGAADAARRPQHRLPRRLAVRHGRRAAIMCLGLYSGNFLAMCAGRSRSSATPSPVCRCTGSPRRSWCRCTTAPRRSPGSPPAASLPAVIGPTPRAHHPRPGDAALSSRPMRRSSALHMIVFTIMSFIKFPSTRELVGAGGRDAHAGAPPRPLWVIASQPRFIASRDRRHAGVRHHGLHHERLAAGHRRLRLSARGGALGDLRARARHVRAVVLHRQPDQPLRHHARDGRRHRADAGRRRRRRSRAWPN